ncbi:MAG: hypothetical protein COB02_15695 [Candidatus Cloacimonadota bacterium]|nr:MAG: hypothetical protein COB02_15695 [Candidatus Cloacimonadota bacterium]
MKKTILFTASFCFVLMFTIVQLYKVFTLDFFHLVQIIPDDTFYYFEIARNFLINGVPSFDGKDTTTSGYHMLWFLIISGSLKTFSFNRIETIQFFSLVSISLSTLFVYGAFFKFRKQQNILFICLLSAFFTSFSFLNNMISSMEWVLLIPLHIILYFMFLNEDHKYFKIKCCFFFILGVLGSLSRTDFGAIAFIFISFSMLYYFCEKKRNKFLESLSLLLGAIIGLLICFSWHYYHTDSIIQVSAKIKSMWGLKAGISPVPIIQQIVRVFVYLPRTNLPEVKLLLIQNSKVIFSLLLIFMTSFLFIFKTQITKIRLKFSSEKDLLFYISIAIVLFYTCFYSINSTSIQIWYTAHLTVPCFYISYYLLSKIKNEINLSYALLMISLINSTLYFMSPPIYQGQKGSAHFAEALKLIKGKIGISDAGLVGFHKHNIINLDGLVNNELYPYAPYRLHCYLLDSKIEYFTGFGADFNNLFSYDNSKFSTKHYWKDSKGKTFSILKVDFETLKKDPKCNK